MNPKPRVMRRSSTPVSQLSSRGALYAPVKKTRSMWMKTSRTMPPADQRWIERIHQPNCTRVEMLRTLWYAASGVGW